MKSRPFQYARPTDLAEARRAYAEADCEPCFIAGGQSLVPALAMRLRASDLLIDIGHIPELRGITVEDGFLRLGALTRHSEILSHPAIASHAPLLREAASHVAHPAVRNRGTLGGSIALADPASEFPAMLLVLDAEIEMDGEGGRSTMRADDFFKDLYETALEPGALITAVRIPSAPVDSRCAFDELARRRGDYAIVGLGIQATYDGDVVRDLRMAFLSVGPTPMRARAAEAALRGTGLDASSVAAAQAALGSDLDPSEDVHVSSAMRLHLARVLLGRLAGRLREAGR